MQLRSRAALNVAALALIALPAGAGAGAPPPAKPVSRDVYAGRWYEIARTPNRMQRDCQSPTTDFQAREDTDFTIVETCHRGPSGAVSRTLTARARILTPDDNTRFRLSFLGGLIHQEYWILDHAADNSWLLMGTPGGHFVWLLSRNPSLPPALLATAIGRAGSLGYPLAKLIYPGRNGG
jgi:apolipoprotein D and lipocalin family protein